MRGTATRRGDEAVDAQLFGQFVQGLTLYQFAAGAGEESLTLAFKMSVYDISHHRIQDGIAKELKPFVVQRFAFFRPLGHTLVHEGEFVIFDVAGIKADDFL